MTYLLIDNSNTRTKFVLSTPDALLPERYMIPTREVSEERLDEVLAGVHYDAAFRLDRHVVRPCGLCVSIKRCDQGKYQCQT